MEKKYIKEEVIKTIDRWLEQETQDLQNLHKDLNKSCSRGDTFNSFEIERFIEWRTEDLIKTSHMITQLHEIKAWIKTSGLKKGLLGFKDYLTKQIINFPYIHNSTSVTSNAIREWKKQVDCNLIRNNSCYSISSLILMIERG